MYIPVKWKDHIVQFRRRFRMRSGESEGLVYLDPAPGDIEQQGTPQSKTNFGQMDYGIVEANLLANFALTTAKQQAGMLDGLTGQQFDVTLKNTLQFPATNASATIVLKQYLNNTDYQIHYKILEKSGGYVDDVEFYDIAENGFKVRYRGSASTLRIRIYVTGGM